jgi:hypothetical protein
MRMESGRFLISTPYGLMIEEMLVVSKAEYIRFSFSLVEFFV